MDQERPIARRPGGRSERIRQAVLAATIELILEGGISEVTVTNIAKRSGVHPTTIYRRWDGVGGVLVEALLEEATMTAPPPDTGSLYEDLVIQAQDVRRRLLNPLAKMMTLAIAKGQSGEFTGVAPTYWHDRLSSFGVIIERGIERGELPPGTDPILVLEMVSAPILSRFYFGVDIPEEFPETVVRTVLAGVAATAPATLPDRKKTQGLSRTA
jgi:AcrR family transcriptional regulator